MGQIIQFPHRFTLDRVRIIPGLAQALPKVKWEVPEYEIIPVRRSLVDSLFRKLRDAALSIRVFDRFKRWPWP